MRWVPKHERILRDHWYPSFAWLPVEVLDEDRNKIMVWWENIERIQLRRHCYSGGREITELARLPGGKFPEFGYW